MIRTVLRVLGQIALCALASTLLCTVAYPAFAAHLDITDTHAFYPEGPLWYRGRLYYVEYARNDIKVWDGRRAKVFWHKKGCGPTDLIPFHGNVLIACYDANALEEISWTAREISIVRADRGGTGFVAPNDLAMDGHGGIYFSASGVFDMRAPISGEVLYIAPDGRTISRVADTIDYSAGLAVSRDGKSLLVAEMLAGRILSFPIELNGSLGRRTVWARLQDLAPPTPREDA